MSRVGKKLITIPEQVTVAINNQEIKVKGPKGELNLKLPERIILTKNDNQLLVNLKNIQTKKDQSLWGTYRSLINNLIIWVTSGYQKKLEINGIGYKAQLRDGLLVLNLGFSHPIEFPLPAGIDISVDNNIITVSGIDKYLVGQAAAKIRALRKPEPYKGKGIKYLNEVIRRKAGKVVKTTE